MTTATEGAAPAAPPDLTFCECGDQFTKDSPGTCVNCLAALRASGAPAPRDDAEWSELFDLIGKCRETWATASDWDELYAHATEMCARPAPLPEPEIERVLHVGNQLSNIAFNWAQMADRVPDEADRKMLRTCSGSGTPLVMRSGTPEQPYLPEWINEN